MASVSSDEAKMSKNLIERERRSQMKILFSKLFNLLPPHPTKIKMSNPELLEHVTLYVKQLQERVEELKHRRMKEREYIEGQALPTKVEAISPAVDITLTDLGSSMEVNIIADMETRFALCKIISILEEEGAHVISATYQNAGNKMLFSIRSQAVCSRIGIENSRVHKRLMGLQIS